MNRFLLIVHGDVEPEVVGPFRSMKARDKAAVEHKCQFGDEDGIYMLDTDPPRVKPTVTAYSGRFFMDRLPKGRS
jgi:hypothetical protein